MAAASFQEITGGLHSIENSIGKRLTDPPDLATLRKILGENIFGLYKQGTGKTLVKLCLWSDLLCVMHRVIAPGLEWPQETWRLFYPFFREWVAIFAPHYKSRYGQFEPLQFDAVCDFLSVYQEDSQPFGYKSQTTERAGRNTCIHVKQIFKDMEPLQEYERLVALIQGLPEKQKILPQQRGPSVAQGVKKKVTPPYVGSSPHAPKPVRGPTGPATVETPFPEKSPAIATNKQTAGVLTKSKWAIWLFVVFLLSCGSVLFVGWHFYTTHKARVEAANGHILTAVAEATSWLENDSKLDEETVEKNLSVALQNEDATEKAEGAAMLQQVRQRREELIEERRAADILKDAKKLFIQKQFSKAIHRFRTYLADPNAAQRPDAERLLAKAEKSQSELLAEAEALAVKAAARKHQPKEAMSDKAAHTKASREVFLGGYLDRSDAHFWSRPPRFEPVVQTASGERDRKEHPDSAFELVDARLHNGITMQLEVRNYSARKETEWHFELRFADPARNRPPDGACTLQFEVDGKLLRSFYFDVVYDGKSAIHLYDSRTGMRAGYQPLGNRLQAIAAAQSVRYHLQLGSRELNEVLPRETHRAIGQMADASRYDDPAAVPTSENP